jgi:GT2 family glycosyltransferase
LPVDVSIIIVTFNPGTILRNCLDSLPAASDQLHTEIWIVDNHSLDGTVDRVRNNYPHINLVANADNRGFARANNQALAHAQGDFFLLLNPDVIVSPHAITELTNFLRENPEVGIVGPRVFDLDGSVTLSARPAYSAFNILWQYLGFDRLLPSWVYGRYRNATRYATTPFEAGWVLGACFMFRRQLYDALGGLDENLFLFSEEPDFCERAQSAGWRVMYYPGATAVHHESSTVSRFHSARIFNYHISPLIYFRKRNRRIAVFVLKVGFTIELLLKMLFWLPQIIHQAWRRSSGGESRRISIYWKTILAVWRFPTTV